MKWPGARPLLMSLADRWPFGAAAVVGAIFPSLLFVVMLLATTLLAKTSMLLLLDQVWHWIFFGGILFSLWVQVTITLYFQFTRLTAALSAFSALLPYVASFSVSVASIGILAEGDAGYLCHVGGTLSYLWILVFWDWSDRRSARANNAPLSRCLHDLLRIDSTSAVAVTFWVVAIGVIAWYLGQAGTHSEKWAFAFIGRVSHTHYLREPLLAGAVGFHMAAVALSVISHAREWRLSLPPALTSTQPSPAQ